MTAGAGHLPSNNPACIHPFYCRGNPLSRLYTTLLGIHNEVERCHFQWTSNAGSQAYITGSPLLLQRGARQQAHSKLKEDKAAIILYSLV